MDVWEKAEGIRWKFDGQRNVWSSLELVNLLERKVCPQGAESFWSLQLKTTE